MTDSNTRQTSYTNDLTDSFSGGHTLQTRGTDCGALVLNSDRLVL
jgi:hypothetical protein